MIGLKENCHIGIDVSKNILDIFILPSQKHMQFNNDPKGIEKLIKKLSAFTTAVIVIEATGGYEKLSAQSLTKAGFKVSVVNPRKVRDFAKAVGKLAKTDKLDAHIIALYSQKLEPQANVMCDEKHQTIVENNTRRRQLIDMIKMEKNRLDKVSKGQKESIDRILEALEKELKKINEEQEKAITSNAEYSEKYELLKSIKGVAGIVAAGIIADLPELGQISAKQISAIAGLAPYNCDSGSQRGKRAIWGGRASVRSILYMATLSAIRCNPAIKVFYQRLCGVGKQKKVALTACSHKLLIVMNAMIKNKQTWRSELLAPGESIVLKICRTSS